MCSITERRRKNSTGYRRRWPRIRIPGLDGEWSAALAYALGLLATDGGLTGGDTVAFKSKDRELVETLRSCLGAAAPIRPNAGLQRIQMGDVRFYDWLESIGVTSRKSLTLGAVAVPSEFFFDLVRGLLDGDGSVLVQEVTPNPRRYPLHRYQQLRVRFHCASPRHLDWLRAELLARLGIVGWIYTNRGSGLARVHVLQYSKHESITLLETLYAVDGAPRLDRKWSTWNDFRVRGRPTRIWTDRRSDETGRHSGLKIPWAQAREGSNPSSGTELASR